MINIDMCPHMPARCPHHSEWCEYEESSECHHVISFKNTLAILATRALKFDLGELPRELGDMSKRWSHFWRNYELLQPFVLLPV